MMGAEVLMIRAALAKPVVLAVLLSACGTKDTLPPPSTPGAAPGAAPEAAAAERAAYERARPVFEKHCARCHTSAGAKASPKTLGHFSMDGYPFGGHHAASAGATVREVLGVGGEGPATMPADDPGAVQGDELQVVVDWSRAFDAAHPGAAAHDEDDEDHEHQDHDHDGHHEHDEHHEHHDD